MEGCSSAQHCNSAADAYYDVMLNSCKWCSHRNEVYLSNRAAAYTSLKRYPAAVADAKRVIQLKPKWVKGYSRLAAAHFGNEDFSEVM